MYKCGRKNYSPDAESLKKKLMRLTRYNFIVCLYAFFFPFEIVWNILGHIWLNDSYCDSSILVTIDGIMIYLNWLYILIFLVYFCYILSISDETSDESSSKLCEIIFVFFCYLCCLCILCSKESAYADEKSNDLKNQKNKEVENDATIIHSDLAAANKKAEHSEAYPEQI